MTVRAAAALRVALLALGAVCYDLLAHYSNLPSTARSLGAALASMPPLLLSIGFAWRSAHRVLVLLCCALLVMALIAFWPLLQRHFAVLYLLQQCGMWGALLFGFARSLRAGAVPLCTHWADLLHGPLTAAELRYTRRVTQAWCVFFAAMGITGLLLFFGAAVNTWSAFNNLCTVPLLALMFGAEYAIRLLVLPRTRGSGLFEVVRLVAASRR